MLRPTHRARTGLANKVPTAIGAITHRTVTRREKNNVRRIQPNSPRGLRIRVGRPERQHEGVLDDREKIEDSLRKIVRRDGCGTEPGGNYYLGQGDQQDKMDLLDAETGAQTE